MGPAIFGVSVSQLSLLINTIFASLLVTGSVSWMYYADRLMEFPAGLLGVALGTILLPSLAKHYSTNSNDEYSRLLDWGLRMTMLLTLTGRTRARFVVGTAESPPVFIMALSPITMYG
jgi:putative peptidoglycan lipid II flippase